MDYLGSLDNYNKDRYFILQKYINISELRTSGIQSSK